jgi:hypothetical protein
MSAKTVNKTAAAAKKAALNNAESETVEAGTQIVFTGFRVPIEGDTDLNIGDPLFVSSYNDDDGSYNVSRTEKSTPIDTLFREEFRLETDPAEEEEVSNKGKSGTVASKPAAKTAAKKTDAEADSGSSSPKVKDEAGKTVVVKVEKPVKAAKTEAAAVPVTLIPSLKKVVSDEGGLIKAAEALSDRVGETEHSLGGILGKINETRAFEELLDADGQPLYTGHVGFGKFCESHLGIKYRKATYLIGNYVCATECGITPKQMSGIGWSKFKEAVSILTSENKDEILEDAKSMPYDEFKAAMKTRLINGGGKLHGNTNTAELTSFTFRLHNDKATVLMEALDKAKAVLGIEGKDVTTNSAALDHIVSEWVSMQD